MNTIRQLARRGTPLFAASWLLFVLLTALQPCCDAVADIASHEHAAAAHASADDHDSRPGSEHDHSHCGLFDQWQGSEFVAAVSETAQPQTPDFLVTAMVDTPPVAPLSAFFPRSSHPWLALASPPVFLLTQRLRI